MSRIRWKAILAPPGRFHRVVDHKDRPIARAPRRGVALIIAAMPDLLEVLGELLGCPDLNLDELEPETIRVLKKANALLKKIETTINQHSGYFFEE